MHASADEERRHREVDALPVDAVPCSSDLELAAQVALLALHEHGPQELYHLTSHETASRDVRHAQKADGFARAGEGEVDATGGRDAVDVDAL